MASTVDTCLTLREICDVLGTVSRKWRKIGVQLGVPYHKLEEFKKEDDPLAAVINCWLKGNVEGLPIPACWESIVTALKSSHVGEDGLAVDISTKYCQENKERTAGAITHLSPSVAASVISTNTSSGSSSQLSEVELQSHFPYLDKSLPETERSRYLKHLYDEYEEMKTKFANLVIDFQQSLEKSTHKLEDIVNYIKYYFYEECTEVEELLSTCKTISDVFGRIRRYMSFFNIGVIKPLIKKFGSPAILKKLKKYKKKFHDYCKHRICECPRNAFGDDNEMMTDKVYILKTELKMTDDFKKLESAMNNIFVGKHFLRLLHVDEGCVKLTFRVLAGLSSSLTEEQQQSLRDNGVLRITYGDQQYDLSHLNQTKILAKIGKLSSCNDSAYVSASATHSTNTATTELDEINPAEKLLKSAEPTGVDSRANLHDIITRGEINILKIAIEEKAYNPLSKDVYGYTALHTAAKYGKLEVMKYLIEEEGINPSIPGPQGATPLNVAAETGNLSIVKYLIEDQHVDPSADKDEDGYLPLHRACFTNKIKLVKYLFQKMKEACYVENKDILCEFTKYDSAPLHIAALHGHLDIVKFFTEECECDPNLSNKAGRTALFFACENGNLKIVQYLVEIYHCLSSVATDNSSNTPLHLAAQHGNLSIVQYLIEEKGCETKCHNNQGNTPLLEASFAGMLNIVNYFVKIGCDPKINENNNGYNCLHAACRHGHTEIIQYLIKEQHMDPNTPTRNTKTNSLHIAATFGHEPTVRYLIEVEGLDLNCRDEKDYTPYHLAALHNNLGVLRYLIIIKQCNPLIATSRNETLYTLAEEKGNHKMVQFIKTAHKNFVFNSVSMYYAKIIMKRESLAILRKHKSRILHHISLNEFDMPLVNIAAGYGNLEIVKYFIEEGIYRADCKDIDGLTPLHMAASSGHIEIFQYLMKECSCDLACRTGTQQYGGDEYSGMTPLHSAVLDNKLAMVQHIMESDYKVDPEVQTHEGRTPLFAAVHLGHIDIIKYLINKHKCNLSHRDKKLWTALHCAAKEGRLQVVKYLINDQNCDPFAEVKYLLPTSFHLAAIYGRLEIIDYYIKELKVSPNLSNKSQLTALHFAAANGHKHVVEYLTKLPDCNHSCTDTLFKCTPLHLAVQRGQLEIVKYLTKTAKCSHMDEDVFRDTPLHLAAKYGHFEVTKFLIEEMHTPPALKNFIYQTPLHLALYNGQSKVALYLIVVLYNECHHV